MIKNDSNNNSNISTRVVTAHLPSDLVVQLDELTSRMERSKAWVIKEAITAWIELETKRHQLTLGAITDVKSGKVVKHKKVEDWVNNLFHSEQ